MQWIVKALSSLIPLIIISSSSRSYAAKVWRLEDFTNFELISQGKSTVQRAIHHPTLHPQIIKKVSVAGFKNCNLAADELKAYQLVKGLPFVADLMGHLNDRNEARSWFIFDYEPAISLDQILVDPTRDSILQAIRANLPFYAANLVIALEGIHSRGVLHNDLKVANTLFSLGTGYLRIIDFGLAEAVDHLSMSSGSSDWGGGIRGSLPGLAPELLQGEPRTFASDWFALGTLIWEMATGTLLYEGHFMREAAERASEAYRDGGTFSELNVSMEDYMRVARHQPVFYPPDMDGDLVSLLQNLLNRNPDQRWCYPDGMAKIKTHPFFKGIDFTAITNQQAHPPLVAI